MSDDFQLGDIVRYGPGRDDLGVICHMPSEPGEDYSVRYIQWSDLSHPPREGGGMGPVWREGYPQPLQTPRDHLIAAGVRAWDRLEAAREEMQRAERDIEAIRRVLRLLEDQR